MEKMTLCGFVIHDFKTILRVDWLFINKYKLVLLYMTPEKMWEYSHTANGYIFYMVKHDFFDVNILLPRSSKYHPRL